MTEEEMIKVNKTILEGGEVDEDTLRAYLQAAMAMREATRAARDENKKKRSTPKTTKVSLDDIGI